MSETKQTNKSFEDLLKNKKTKQVENGNDDSSDMRKKMNRLVDANKVFGDVNDFQDKSNQLAELENEKAALEKEVKELNKKLKALYNLKYDDLKVIDKKNDVLSNDFKSALDNAKTLNEEEKARFENMNLELESLQTQIKALKANNIASRKASEEAIAAANLAQEAATKARVAFEEKEKNSNKDYKEEIEKLNKQLAETTKKLNKATAEKKKFKDNFESLKKDNEAQEAKLAEVEKELEAVNKEKESIASKISDIEKKALANEEKLSKLNEAKLDKENAKQEAKLNKVLEEKNLLKEKNASLQKELNKLEQKANKLSEEKTALNENINSLKQDLSQTNSSVKKLENNVAKLEAIKQEKLDEISNLKKENTALTKKVEKLQSDLNAKLNDVKDEDLKKQYIEKQRELDKLQNNYNKALSNNDELKDNQKLKVQEAKKELNEKFKEEKKLIKQEYNNQIKDLNKEINKLNKKIALKEEKIKELKQLLESNNQNDEKDKIIDDLSLKLVNSEEQVSVLSDKNKDLEEENLIIPSLNDEIKKLSEEIQAKEEQIIFLQEQVKEPKIDESVIKEMEDLQNELDKSIATLEDMRLNKLNLEIELQKAYTALKEQEDILALQENLITKQQVVVETKNNQYQESLVKYADLEKEFNQAKLDYENEIKVLKDDNSGAQEKLSDIFELQSKLDEANQEIQIKASQLEEVSKEIEELKSEKEKNEEVIKQYLNDIEENEKKISECLASLSQNEIEVQSLQERLENVNNEYETYKVDAQKEIDLLVEEISQLKEQLNEVEDSSKVLELSKFNEERLQSRIQDLENSLKNLNLNENPTFISPSNSSVDQYRSLLANERKEHEEAENILVDKIKDLNNELEGLNARVASYSSSYAASKLNKQINLINEIITSIKNGKTLFNRDIYNDYYEEALKMYYEQKKIYSLELDKRNEMLQIIKNEKEQEIRDLSYEVQVHGPNTLEASKLKVLYQQVKDIDLIINANVRAYTPMTSEAVEEEILNSFKKELFAYHKQMEENIALIEKNINEKYNGIDTFEKLIEVYSDDCLEMANKYSDEISRLYKENQFDTNEFSKLIREEKILILVNEFQSLVRIRDDRYLKLQSMLSSIENDISFDEYNDSLNSIEELKKTLLKKLDTINIEEQRVKELLYEERKRMFDDIDSLNEQLVQLEKFNEDQLISEDKRRINVLLAAKKEKIELLDKERIPETEEKYASLKEDVKISYDEAIMEENAIKQAFVNRKEAIHSSKYININVSQQIKKLDTYENINNYLVDLNNIDNIFSEIRSNRKAYRPVVKEEQNGKLNNFKAKFNNLWALYDKYDAARVTMEEDFEDIRMYNNFKLEASSTYRKYVELLKEIEKSEERFRSGLDLDQNIVKSLQAKANTAKSRVDYLNRQAGEMLRNSMVYDYVELVNKIDQIKELIKQMESEVEGII